MNPGVAISMIAGNTDDTLDVFFHWAIENFDEVNVVCQPDNYDATLETCKHWAEIEPALR